MPRHRTVPLTRREPGRGRGSRSTRRLGSPAGTSILAGTRSRSRTQGERAARTSGSSASRSASRPRRRASRRTRLRAGIRSPWIGYPPARSARSTSARRTSRTPPRGGALVTSTAPASEPRRAGTISATRIQSPSGSLEPEGDGSPAEAGRDPGASSPSASSPASQPLRRTPRRTSSGTQRDTPRGNAEDVPAHRHHATRRKTEGTREPSGSEEPPIDGTPTFGVGASTIRPGSETAPGAPPKGETPSSTARSPVLRRSSRCRTSGPD